MQRERLKLIVKNLKLLLDALESEVHSDPDSYVTEDYKSDNTLISDDDDGYPD